MAEASAMTRTFFFLIGALLFCGRGPAIAEDPCSATLLFVESCKDRCHAAYSFGSPDLAHCAVGCGAIADACAGALDVQACLLASNPCGAGPGSTARANADPFPECPDLVAGIRGPSHPFAAALPQPWQCSTVDECATLAGARTAKRPHSDPCVASECANPVGLDGAPNAAPGGTVAPE